MIGDKPVLVIDDFQNMRNTLRQMLLTIGFTDIDQAGDAEEALAALRARRHPIILCDYNLGEGLDGQQLLDQAKAESLIGLGSVFIMVTAEKSHEMVLGALESAPDAYLAKPFTKDLLHARLSRALRRRAPLIEVARALSAGGPSAALKVLEREIKFAGDNPLELLRVRAELAFAAEDLDLAEASAAAAMIERPLAWALTLQGQVADARGNPDVAEALYRRSMALTPHFMVAHDRLAQLCEDQGRQAEALTILQAAAERSPKSLPRQRRLARLAIALKRPDLAEPAWLRVLALGRQIGQPRAADHFGLVETLLARGNGREARKRARIIPEHCAKDPEAPWWSLAARLRCLGPNPPIPASLQLLEELAEHRHRYPPPPPPVAEALRAALQVIGAKMAPPANKAPADN